MIYAGIKNKVTQLLAVLDQEIVQLKINLERVTVLREAVVKRDEQRLTKLLEDIRSSADGYANLETQRNSLRQGLAVGIGCGFDEMNLSLLQRSVPDDISLQIAERKELLQNLAERFQKEQLATAIMLNECARINRQLLTMIFNFADGKNKVYGSNGTAKRNEEAAFMNMKL